jgi:hypothetical protein
MTAFYVPFIPFPPFLYRLFRSGAEHVDILGGKFPCPIEQHFPRVPDGIFDDFCEKNIEDGADFRSGSEVKMFHEISSADFEHLD